MKIIYLEEFGRALLPAKFRPNIREYLLKAGIESVPYKFFGFLFYMSVVITGLIYVFYIYPGLSASESVNLATAWGLFLFALISFAIWAAIQGGILTIMIFITYSYLDYVIYTRTKAIEEVLQEFLRYVSENLKGGMSIESALWESIRPKFGVLAEEIRLTAKRVMTGQDVDEALHDFSNKYDSPTVKRTFDLIIEGMRGGIDIAELIDKLEVNLRETKELKDEIVAINSTYVIFLTAISFMIAPALFGLSFNLLIILKQISCKLGQSASGVASGQLPIDLSKINVEPDNFATFSLYVLGVTSMFIAMMVSLIRNGNIKQGIKYVPVFGLGSVVMYLFFKAILRLIFSGLISIEACELTE